MELFRVEFTHLLVRHHIALYERVFKKRPQDGSIIAGQLVSTGLDYKCMEAFVVVGP